MNQPEENTAEKRYQDTKTAEVYAHASPDRNFLTLSEMNSFLEDSCSTCFCEGVFSDERLMQNHSSTCQIDKGRCVLSFPSQGVKRVDDKVQCRYYEQESRVNGQSAI